MNLSVASVEKRQRVLWCVVWDGGYGRELCGWWRGSKSERRWRRCFPVQLPTKVPSLSLGQKKQKKQKKEKKKREKERGESPTRTAKARPSDCKKKSGDAPPCSDPSSLPQLQQQSLLDQKKMQQLIREPSTNPRGGNIIIIITTSTIGYVLFQRRF
jgi:hypothetical protein